MPISSVSTDTTSLTMTVVFDAAVTRQRLWDAYADPRQIERLWGPPTWPATFFRHDMFSAGQSWYAMTGPEGERSDGYWVFIDVIENDFFEVQDGFAHPDGTPNTDLPSMRMVYAFSDTDSGSRLTITTHFPSLGELEQLKSMGMEEGMSAAMGQIEDVLADEQFSPDKPATLQLLSDTQVRVSRVLAPTVQAVWDAHHDPAKLRQWLLGPDGWTMPVCLVSTEVGGQYRYEWEDSNAENRFGFTGEVLDSAPPRRAVTTERLLDMDGEGTVNEMTLTPLTAGTLLSLIITYPSKQMRDIVLGTGMVDGMETSYQRLESLGF